MKKCIYKITNIIDGKIYIGSTNDYNRRYREHKNKMYGNCDKVLYDAIDKYGFENFTMELIEDYTEKYKEREQYWIDFYNSKEEGYNVDFSLVHADSHIVIDEETLLKIYSDLKDLSLNYNDIAKKYNFKSTQSIRDINRGITYHHKDINYPIRKMRNDLAKERALQVINDLKNTNLKFSELAKKYHCSGTTISNINTGIRNKQDNEQYPIRPETRKSQKFSEQILDDIYDDIINTNLKWTELAEKYNCQTKVFQHINQGISNKRDGYIYPLRKEQNKKGSDKAVQIIELLETTNLTFKAIAEKLNTNSKTVSNINKGKSHKQDNRDYPIRK